MFLKFASTAPSVALSPHSKSSSYLGKANDLPSPSPTSKMRRMALQDPTKKGLAEYDKTLVSHEQAVRKGLHELDKATNDFRESAEMREAEKKKMAEKLMQKRKRAEEMALNARRTEPLVLKTELDKEQNNVTNNPTNVFFFVHGIPFNKLSFIPEGKGKQLLSRRRILTPALVPDSRIKIITYYRLLQISTINYPDSDETCISTSF